MRKLACQLKTETSSDTNDPGSHWLQIILV